MPEMTVARLASLAMLALSFASPNVDGATGARQSGKGRCEAIDEIKSAAADCQRARSLPDFPPGQAEGFPRLWLFRARYRYCAAEQQSFRYRSGVSYQFLKQRRECKSVAVIYNHRSAVADSSHVNVWHTAG